MKHTASEDLGENGLRAAQLFPLDLFTPLAQQLDLDDTGTTFRFMLLCRDARRALEPVLLQWACRLESLRPTCVSLGPGLAYDGGQIVPTAFRKSHIRPLTRIAEVTRSFCWPVVTERSPPALVLTLYYAYHCRSLVNHCEWFSCEFRGKTMVCHCEVAGGDQYKDALFREDSHHEIDYLGHVHWQALNERIMKPL